MSVAKQYTTSVLLLIHALFNYLPGFADEMERKGKLHSYLALDRVRMWLSVGLCYWTLLGDRLSAVAVYLIINNAHLIPVITVAAAAVCVATKLLSCVLYPVVAP